MDSLPVNAIDLAVIAIVLISGLLALMRGFVHEALMVAAWVGAIFATLYGFAYAKPYARDLIPYGWLADGAAGLTIFLVTLFILWSVSRYLASHVQGSTLNPLDRTLGFLYGLLRGAVVVILAYLAYAVFVPPAEQPGWVRDARSMPLIESGGDLLRKLIPGSTEESAAAAKRRTAEDAAASERAYQDLSNPRPKSAGRGDASGYNSRERRDLDRLFQTTEER